ncbi:fused MFS/spermidine synthase [bacterium]|nr:fused MFS/spermidine synthase [bacterium]RQV92111.1 MAG: hypothetical protein EH221_12595 [bacterium]
MIVKVEQPYKTVYTMNHRRERHFLIYAIFVIGLTSIVAQILLLRELVVVFFGNELSLGVMLGVWLFWTAIGSGLSSRLFIKIHRLDRFISLFQFILAVFLPFILIFVRSSKELIGITFGEMIGFVPMLLITLISLTPFCILAGLLYSLACQYLQQLDREPTRSMGKVYLIEAIGSGIGGLLVSFILIRFIHPALTFLLLSGINLMSALLIQNSLSLQQKGKRKFILPAILIIYGLMILGFSQQFQRVCDQILWKRYNLIWTQNTIFGNLSVIRMEEQISLFENGLHLFTSPDPFIAEESVHFALLEHKNPKTVLLIGGGLGGGIQQTLKHPSVQSVDYVELDPTVVRLAEQFLDSEQVKPLHDPRVTIHNVDGRHFIKKTSKNFDVIILNLPNPYTAQINRYYTLEFYQEIERILNKDGVFSFQVTSSENMISDELSDFLSTLASTLSAVFPDRVIIPGETNHFIVSTTPQLLTSDPQVLVARLQDRELQTQYIREYYLPYRMSQERQTYLQSRLHPVSAEKLNQDFKPIGYYYDTVLWATYFSGFFKTIFTCVSRLNISYIVGFIMLFTLTLIFWKWRPTKSSQLLSSSVLFSIFTVGLSEISLEVILILGFQILYGYVYYQLAIIITGYMTGLSFGSWLAISRKRTPRQTFILFRRCQLSMFLYTIFIILILWTFHRYPLWIPNHPWMSWTFPFTAMGAGFIGGYQFPLANRLYFYTGQSAQKVAGTLYSLDLFGSSSGALLISTLFLPIFGLFPTLFLIVILNGCCLIVLMLSKESE